MEIMGFNVKTLRNSTIVMECSSLYEALLKFDQNVILNVNWECIEKIFNKEKLIEGDDIFEIQPPCTDPKPEGLLSAWPPHDRCYFYHDYYNGSSSEFFCVGDHIANFNPSHKEAVLALNRLNLMVLFSKTREEKWYFENLMASLKSSTKFTIFTGIDFSSIHPEYLKYQKVMNDNTVKTLERKIKRRVQAREVAMKKFVTKYDSKTEILKTELKRKSKLTFE
jgi:hypothetical protein